MNWEATGAIGEIVGALAVLITLIFLVVQIRANTKALRANSEYDIDRRWSELNLEVGRDPDYTEIWSKIFSQDASVEDFTPTELVRVHHIIRGFLQFYQGSFYAHKNGILTDRRWNHDRAYVQKFVNLPVVKSLVEEDLRQDVLQREFAEDLFSSSNVLDLSLGVKRDS